MGKRKVAESNNAEGKYEKSSNTQNSTKKPKTMGKYSGDVRTQYFQNKHDTLQDASSSSSENEYEQVRKREIPETKINIKEIKKRETSSSSESSEDETFLFNIQDSLKTKVYNGGLSPEGNENSSSDSEEEKNASKNINKPALQKIKKENSSNSENELKSSSKLKIKNDLSSEDSESSSSDSEDEINVTKIKVKPVLQIKKEKKIKKEDSSNSDESKSISDSEIKNKDSGSESDSESVPETEHAKKVQIRKKIKKKNSSSEVQSSSSEDENNTSDNENRNSLQRKKLQVNRPYIKKEIRTASSSSDSDTEDRRKIMHSNIKRFHKRKSLEESSSSNESKEIKADKFRRSPEKINNILYKIHKKSLQESTKQNENDQSELEIRSSLKNEKAMKQIAKTLQDNSQDESFSSSDSDVSTKSKITVLQNIHLNPMVENYEERLEMRYPGVKQMKTNIKLNFSDADDVYLFRIPKNIDPNLLLNRNFDCEKKFKLKLGEKYNIKPTTKILDPKLVVSDSCKVIHFKSNIIMEKSIKSRKEPEIVIPEKKTVPLPDNLKNRHPLFGSNFKDKIILSDDVERKLDNAIADILRKEKKEKKKKHKKMRQEQENEKQKEDIFNLLNSHSNVKKIKKDTSEDSAFSSSGSLDKSNKKIRQNMPDGILKNIKKEYDSDSFRNKSPTKKRKHSVMVHEWDAIPQKKIKTDVDLDTSSKPEKERHSYINSTHLDTSYIPRFNPNLSQIGSEASTSQEKSKKAKRKKEPSKDEGVENQFISDILNSIKSNVFQPIKTKKKKKHKDLEN